MNWSVPLAVLAALVAFHLLTAALAYRLRPTAADARSTTVENPEEYVDGDSVVCPDCETENERGYRFCRACVAELPRPMAFTDGSTAPTAPGIR